ncbi:MAG: pyridoxal phosphate-dependent aminotransferase [Armatimonadetes bacterium]|nr:pyridoxal phosphate-dependent aminotransferase [Armatimonadota bacterium]
MEISDLIAGIAPSPTIAGAAKAREMRAAGQDVLSFAIGEPDFGTPANIIAAAEQAMAEQKTKYTPAGGIPELKKAICEAQERDLGLRYEPSQVVVSNGGKHALMNIWRTLLNPGDEVIMFAPYWVSYPEQVRLTGAKTVPIITSGDNDFQPDLDAVAAAVTPRTKALLINSPSNPSGAVFSRETLEGLGELACKHDLTIVSDEIYKHIIYDGRTHESTAKLSDELKARTIIADGVAKTYAMTGWRIGWLIAPPAFAKAADNLQSQETSNPNSIAQWASIEALLGPQDSVAQMRDAFMARRDYLVPALNEIEGVKCANPGGAFYVFPDISAHLGWALGGREIKTSVDMELYLIEEALIATVAGGPFGTEGYIRLSFACSMTEIQEGVRRLAAALA